MIRVLVVDDQELVRAGLRGILRTDFGFDVVGECADGSEVIAAVEPLTPLPDRAALSPAPAGSHRPDHRNPSRRSACAPRPILA
jgi:chemotaxis response regulator CheB